MRIGIDAGAGIGQANPVEQVSGAGDGLVPGGAAMQHLGFADLHAQGERWVEAGHRLLENHRDPVAADSLHLGLREFQQILAFEQDFPGRDPPGGLRDEAHQGQGGDRFARARFADDRQRFAGFEIERHPIDRGEHTAIGPEGGGQALDGEQRHQWPIFFFMS